MCPTVAAQESQLLKGPVVPHSQAGTQPPRGMLETEQGHRTSQLCPPNIRVNEKRNLKDTENKEIQIKHSQILMLATIVLRVQKALMELDMVNAR